MSSMFSSLSSQNPPAADTETPKSDGGMFSSLTAPKQNTSMFSSLADQPKPEQNAETVPVTAPPASGPSAGQSMFSSLTDNQTPAEKYSVNPVLTNEEIKYEQKSPDEMEEEPWYSKSWEWLNSPLYDLHKWGTRTGAGAFEKGLETGLEDIGSGFTSPLQIGLTLATFGGGAVEEAGISALRAIGVSKTAAPIVASTAKALMTAGFTAQMLGGLVTQVPQFLDALKDGDVENATRLGTGALASGLFLREGLKHGFEDIAAAKNYIKGKRMTTTDQLAAIKELSGIYDESLQKGSDNARARAEEITAQLKAAGAFGDDITEAGIRHFITQDGDLDRINKMAGIAEGTIKPREWTPEEKAQQEKVVELRKWAEDSDKFTKATDGSPLQFFTKGAAEGTDKLGQTLASEGKPEDAHYIQVKNPYVTGTKESLDKLIEQSGGQEATKKLLQDRGHDAIVYNTKNPQVITFDNTQFRPTEQFAEAHNAAWSRDHAYIAIDKKNLDKVMNQGIGLDPKRNNVQYHASPDLAIENATLPDSGNKSDLVVLSVPRAEVEQGVYETNAAVHAKTADRAQIGPVEVLPRVKRESLPAGSGAMNDPAGAIVPPQPGYEPHLAIDEAFKKKNDITSDREIHAHELAHAIWASLGKFPLGDIESHKNIQAEAGNYVAAADINIDKFQTYDYGTKTWNWDPAKIKDEHVQPLVDAMMAGTVS